LRRLCNAAREDGIASWVATVQAAAIAGAAWACWAAARHDPATHPRRHGWLLVALVLSWVAFDDGARVHEALGTMVDEWLDPIRRDPEATGILAWVGRYPSYGWQLIVAPPLGVAGALGCWFFAREVRGSATRRLLVAMLLIFAVTLAMDFVEGLDRDHPWNVWARFAVDERLDDWSHRRFDTSAFATLQHGARVVEELLEVAGGTVLLVLLLGHLTASRSCRPRESPDARRG
jgi:hypothetical protein